MALIQFHLVQQFKKQTNKQVTAFINTTHLFHSVEYKINNQVNKLQDVIKIISSLKLCLVKDLFSFVFQQNNQASKQTKRWFLSVLLVQNCSSKLEHWTSNKSQQLDFTIHSHTKFCLVQHCSKTSILKVNNRESQFHFKVVFQQFHLNNFFLKFLLTEVAALQ